VVEGSGAVITLAGLSHHTAPLDIRERLAVPDDDVTPFLQAADARFGRGAALLSTCNRLELYVGGDQDAAAMRAFMGEQLRAPGLVERHILVERSTEAIHHLYGVASGIDSMVLGETEVLGQVRTAFSATVRAKTDDVVISRLFHTALRAGRRARTETTISTRALSVSSIAAQQAKTLFPDLGRASVLVIGAGEAGRLAAQAIVAHGASQIVVTNRTAERATGLAVELGGSAVPFELLPQALASAHIVIAASGASEPLVTVETLREAMTQRDGNPLLIVDIGVPRDFEPGARLLPGVTYYDLDDLQAVADRNADARRSEVQAVRAIIEEETAKFVDWAASQQVQPTVTALAERAEATRQAELAKTLRRLRANGAQRAEFEELADTLTKALVKQLLADPINVLRERGDLNFTLEAARALFRLDPQLDE
jgi:glutamyl-tRNA reductase